MSYGRIIGSALLFVVILGAGAALAAWKRSSNQASDAAAAAMPEPMEVVTVAVAKKREHRSTATAIGTVLALRSVTLRNELSGTVKEVKLVPGAIVQQGDLLVSLDVSVEEAELKAQEAQAALAETLLDRTRRASENRAASEVDVDRARAERDVALAVIARTKAVIARKTIRAPFRARVGMSDVHPGQYLNEGTPLTTLQGVDDAAHVDFSVAQRVAAGLREGDPVEIFTSFDARPIEARIVAVDARIDPATRNATVRARVEDAAAAPSPGASVRVRVSVGQAREAVSIPVSALRKGPAGDHVYLVGSGEDGKTRARVRKVQSGPALGDDILILEGLKAGDQVASSGSFKLREGALVVVTDGHAGAAAH